MEASLHQRQLREDGATMPQADMGAVLYGARSQMSAIISAFQEQTSTMMVAFQKQTSAMKDASRKQTWDLVKQMIWQEVPQGAHGPEPQAVDTQAMVLKAIHLQETFCPPPSEARANQSGVRR